MPVEITPTAETLNAQTVQIFVCGKCKPTENTGDTPGPDLFKALQHALLQQADIAVDIRLRQAGCHGVCKRPATLTIATPGKHSYVFADVLPEHVPDVLQFAQQFKANTHGAIAKKERPESLQTRLIAKLPPIFTS